MMPLTLGNLGPISNGNVLSGMPVSINQVLGVAVAATTAQLGVNAFGPIAAGSAHGANNPVQISGSDGTNVRRILTDTNGNTQVVGPVANLSSLIPPTSNPNPEIIGVADVENRVRRVASDALGRVRIQNEESGSKDDGIIDALNNVVRELKLLNARITDLPMWMGIGTAMPDDSQAFRDDPTIFNQ